MPKKKVANAGEAESLPGVDLGALAAMMTEGIILDTLIQLFDGFEDGKNSVEMLSDELVSEALPGVDASLRMLDHGHGHNFHGRLAEFVIYQVRNLAGLEPVEFEGVPPLEEKGEPSPPGYTDGICGGLLLRQLQEAVQFGDAGFFRILADMIENDFSDPPNQLDAVAYALQAKLELEEKGKPATKKAVSEAAEQKRAEFQLRGRGLTPSRDLIAKEIDRLNWNWKRIWKKHPDFAGLAQDPGGAPKKSRKPGTK